MARIRKTLYDKSMEAMGERPMSDYDPLAPQGAAIPTFTGPRVWKGETAPVLPNLARPSLLQRTADYLSGADVLRARPTATAMAGPMLASTPTLASSPLMALSELKKRSVRGSGAFTEAEIKQGYRKIGKGSSKKK
jgi:hypothetical protein